MQKKTLILTATFLMTLLIPTALGAAGMNISAILSPEIKLVNNGQIIDTTSNTPITYNGKTYVPIQLVSNTLGYQAAWDAKNQTIQLSPAENQYPLIGMPGFQFISIEPKYEIMTSMDGQRWLGSIKLEYVYQNDQALKRPPVLVIEMVNKDKTVLATKTTLLENKQGTHKGSTLGEYIRLPYSMKTSSEAVVKQMSTDYYYRIKLK
ncbi:stalk domain-containing protein [Brevibacillus ginsengisoli]|uniref:stalk domain-containing protein n=1 Tax=Brevibacillus ginsengisoli TaxID=363854 RepID=UPI003CF3B6F7